MKSELTKSNRICPWTSAGVIKNGGHDVTVYDRSAGNTAQRVTEHGGRSVRTPGEAKRNFDLFSCCPEIDADVRSTDSGDKGSTLKGAILLSAG